MARESEIDATVPADNVQVDKALIRANFEATADELQELFQKTSYAWQIARSGMNRTNL